MSRKQNSLPAITVLLSYCIAIPPVAAQSNSPSIPLPKTIPNGTVVRVNSSSSMMKINEALAQKFKSKFSGTNVKIAYESTDNALKAVLDGKSDLAGIGRPLTDAEKAKGLVALPVTRNKIAMIVSKGNALKSSLTINQFAQIFRGEVTDWSKVGGSAGKIRFLDRPDSSDTRNAFQNYPVFKSAAFKTGATAVKLKEDSTDAVIKELGLNGIGYAIADQVVDNPNVRVVPMHDVQPTDPRYPFSQPLTYVYKGSKPNPTIQAFLGIATANESQKIVEKARVEIAQTPTALIPFTTPPTTTAGNSQSVTSVAPAAPAKVANANNLVANTTNNDSEYPWWVLLIPALGGLLWWVMKGLDKEAPATIAPIANPIIAAKTRDSRVIFTPRDSQHGYAYWEIPLSVQEDLRREGRRGLKLRLHDVTDIDIDLQPSNSVQEFNCKEREPDLHFPIPADNCEYVAEIGYDNNNDEWLRVARSQSVFVSPTVADAQKTVVPQAYNENAQASALWGQETVPDVAETPVPVDSTAAISVAAGAVVGPTLFSFFNRKHQGEEKTPFDAHLTAPPNQVYKENAQASALWGQETVPDVVETPVAASTPISPTVGAVVGPTLFSFFNRKHQGEANNQQVDDSRVILVPRSNDSAYAYWQLSAARKGELQKRGGKGLTLRLHKTDDVYLDTSHLRLAEPIQQYECDGKNDLHINIPECDRNYLAELGYVKDDGSWLKIARSEAVRISSSLPTSDDNTASALPLEHAKVTVSNFTSNIASNTVADIQVNGTNGTKTANAWVESAKNSFGTAVASIGTATSTFFNIKDSSENGDGHSEALNRVATTKVQCQIILVSRNSQSAYAYWEVSEDYKQAARNQGGRRFMLRVHDATNLDIDQQEPHATQEYFCYEKECDKHITIPTSDRDYIAEVGYYTDDNQWIRIIRSLHIRVS
jgi:phosphate transport system substrate-binding protein